VERSSVPTPINFGPGSLKQHDSRRVGSADRDSLNPVGLLQHLDEVDLGDPVLVDRRLRE
jgi:hypothetical protein